MSEVEELVERLSQGVIVIGFGPDQREMVDIVTANQAMRKAAATITRLSEENARRCDVLRAIIATNGEWSAEDLREIARAGLNTRGVQSWNDAEWLRQWAADIRGGSTIYSADADRLERIAARLRCRA